MVGIRIPEFGKFLPVGSGIDLFTDTAAILNQLDLRSIRGHEHDQIYSLSIYERSSPQFFLQCS